jgi:hypothetical protein
MQSIHTASPPPPACRHSILCGGGLTPPRHTILNALLLIRLAAEDGAYHSSAYSPGASAIPEHQQQHQQQQQQQQQPPLQRRRPARGPRDLRNMDGFVSHVMESARTAAACNEQEGARLDGNHRGSDSSSSGSSGHNDTDAAASTHACLEPSLDRRWPSSPPCECYVHPAIYASSRTVNVQVSLSHTMLLA